MSAEIKTSQKAHEYFQAVSQVLKEAPDRSTRRNFVHEEMIMPEWQQASVILRTENAAFRAASSPHPISQQEISLILNSEQTTLLTETQKAIVWAHGIYADYSNLPQSNSNERKKAHHFISTVAKHLIEDPSRIEHAVGYWKSLQKDPQSEDEEGSFYTKVKTEVNRQSEKNWKTINEKTITDIIRLITESPIAKDLAKGILTNIFKGPQDRDEAVNFYYKYANALLDLSNEPDALRQGVLIGLYQTDIVTLKSRFFVHINNARRGSFTTREEEMQFNKVLITEGAIFQAAVATGLDFSIIAKSLREFVDTDPTRVREREALDLRAIKKLDLAQFTERTIALANFDSSASHVFTDGQPLEWPYNILSDLNDPLNHKVANTIRSKSSSLQIHQAFSLILRDLGQTETYLSVSLHLPTSIQDIFVPSELWLSRKKEILSKISEDEIATKEQPRDNSEQTHLVVAWGSFMLEGSNSPILVIRRAPDTAENNLHLLQGLESVGFPTPAVDETSVKEHNQKLRREIKTKQLRFLNKRGVRVSLPARLRRFGYTQIDFQQDASDKQKTAVTLYVARTPYRFLLDENLNIDFEGKLMNADSLSQSILYTTLTLLEPILCQERINPNSPEGPELEIKVTSRMAHLRFLPEGQHFSAYAYKNYFEAKGEDLGIKSEERKITHPKHNNNETTYVKPVIEDDDNLPPIIVYLPQTLLKF
jgi:hypothetical protein